MTEGRSIPLTIFVIYSLWGLVLAATVAGWICMLAGNHPVAQMLGFTACVSSTVAGTASIRYFILRTQRLIRAIHGFDAPPRATAELHTIS